MPIDSSERTEESHECFVFISSKLASDITLTIGQAFELAYRFVSPYFMHLIQFIFNIINVILLIIADDL